MKNRFCRARPDAFSLIEVTLALGVASFCLVVVFGLLPIGINTNRGGVDQGTAASLSSSIVADLRGTPDATNSVNSPFYQIVVPADGGTLQSTSFFVNADGSSASAASPGAYSTFRATVKVTPASAGKVAGTASVWLTWPGAADPDTTKSPSHYSGSYLTVVGLDRN